MLRSVLAFALVAATGAAASAGTYLGLGIGTAPGLSSSGDTMMPLQGNGRSGKLLLGMRFGRLSVEGAAGRYGLFMSQYSYPADGTQLTAALKYSFPLGDNFEAFVRGGLEHTSLVTQQSVHDADSADGNGWLLGGGFEYRLNALVAGASLFVDYEHVSTSLTNNSMGKFDVSSGVWMLGVTLSL
jgi:hypothetical protein